MNCQTDKQRRRSNAASKAMKKRAEHTRCPDCKRGNALSRSADGNGFVVYVCRYCGHEHGYLIGGGDEFKVYVKGKATAPTP